MKKVIEFKNVVSAESTVITTWPRWADYGALTNAVKVIYKDEDGKYQTVTLQTESLDGEDYYEVVVVNTIGSEEYDEVLFQERLGKDGFWAEPGDIIEVVKGRKFPKGQRFVFRKRYEFKDIYGRTQAFYCYTEDHQKVNSDNVIIVGRNK